MARWPGKAREGVMIVAKLGLALLAGLILIVRDLEFTY